MEKKKRKLPIWLKIVLIFVFLILSLIAAATIYMADKFSKIEKIEVEEQVIEESITEEVEHKTGYLNVAVFGLDSRNGTLGKGNRSDTMMIVSLNHETNEVKMVSIYRDTLLKLNDGTYNKANSAYAFYGPEGALALINQNLDMSIDKYVSVNFNALVDVIDAVGGMDLELTYEEVVHMNNYCVETSEVTGKSYEKIMPEEAGTYHLNGVQAVSYSRIRYTAGGDAKRTERQRLVINKILEKAQDMDLVTINKMIDAVFPQVATNFTLSEALEYGKDIMKYKLGDSMGFPEARTSHDLHLVGSSEIADTLESNVENVHQFLFGDAEYEVSSTVKDIDDEIAYRLSSGVYDKPVEEELNPESEDNSSGVIYEEEYEPQYPVFEEEFYYGDE